jgi:hypothetical protein
MHSWKEHIGGCARCQAVLAELAATDSLAVRASAEGSEEPEAWESQQPAAVARDEREQAKSPKKSRILPISRGVRWQWLAPAGALAAGLLVWVAWHEHRPWQTPVEVTTQKAASRPLDQAQTDPFVSLSKEQADAKGAISPEETRRALKQLEKPEARLKSAPAKPPANQEAEGLAKDLVARRPAANQTANEQKPGLAAALPETVVVPTETPNAQMPVQPSPPNAEKSAATGPLPETETAKKSEGRAHSLRREVPAPPSPAFNARLGPSTALMTRASNLNLIATPDKKILWLAGPAGMIEFSSDGGASWSRQASNVVVDLTAGAAPSEKVCWIVGRAGTILRTTDAGSHWALLDSPLGEDLGGVRAGDALHATIWSLGSTKVFQTADGGVSWKPAASQ